MQPKSICSIYMQPKLFTHPVEGTKRTLQALILFVLQISNLLAIHLYPKVLDYHTSIHQPLQREIRKVLGDAESPCLLLVSALQHLLTRITDLPSAE